ncbi:MAG: hypothetical protein JXA71_14635 [Chitinispirillaceae bacterium]|nr:hypothetical protein [Chitinispirillaceae bacterium]
MSIQFTPVETLELFCRFCEKVTPCQLDRSIAGNGRTIDRNSTFEYYCTKCFKTACFSGNDLLELVKPVPGVKQPAPGKQQPREYAQHENYFIGERIFHKKFRETGLVVNKEHGTPRRILVLFQKAGLKKLVEAM